MLDAREVAARTIASPRGIATSAIAAHAARSIANVPYALSNGGARGFRKSPRMWGGAELPTSTGHSEGVSSPVPSFAKVKFTRKVVTPLGSAVGASVMVTFEVARGARSK